MSAMVTTSKATNGTGGSADKAIIRLCEPRTSNGKPVRRTSSPAPQAFWNLKESLDSELEAGTRRRSRSPEGKGPLIQILTTEVFRRPLHKMRPIAIMILHKNVQQRAMVVFKALLLALYPLGSNYNQAVSDQCLTTQIDTVQIAQIATVQIVQIVQTVQKYPNRHCPNCPNRPNRPNCILANEDPTALRRSVPFEPNQRCLQAPWTLTSTIDIRPTQMNGPRMAERVPAILRTPLLSHHLPRSVFLQAGEGRIDPEVLCFVYYMNLHQADTLSSLQLRFASPPFNDSLGPNINRLPNEIINEIFLSGSLTLSTNPAKNTSPAFTLLLVCRHWKALATALTPLWTTLNLDRHYLERRSGRAAAEVLLWKFAKLCLSKSTTQPLHLTFCHAIGAPLERLAQLGATSDRWVTLTLYSNTLTNILNDRKTFVGFPVLQALNTRIFSARTGEVADVLHADLYRDLDVTAPRLAYFRLGVYMAGFQRTRAQDAFLGLSDDIVKSVTHLSVRMLLQLWLLPPRMRTMLVSNMERLTHLYLKLPGHVESESAAFADRFTLPCLTFLSISIESYPSWLAEVISDNVWRNLDHLRLPALEHLCIAQILPETQDPHTNAFFTRFLSNCRQIRTLATRQVSLKHTSALVEALKPERVFLSNNFNRPSMRAIVSDLVKGITNLGESQTTSRLREVILCDLAVSGALLARGIVGTLMECARTQPGFASLDRPVKAVQVHSLSQDVPESLKEYVDRPALMAGVYMRLAFKAREPDVGGIFSIG
ncbi:hypothetical protein DFP72DRAFT_844810 [Ephemerocybe angulata]|uniref:F-box domain-containing protein n=1 Tax=Ephemerocybe angulata TaxID=980116 RepID=A0A8H6MAN6_9AGAR|nr:hypothetical protein DFP72DRAFT_844810 [Tulosesus angulatus]